MRRPCLALSSSCLASSRLCMAKASRGESSGGASPATWSRGDLIGLETDMADFDRMSSCSGRRGVDDIMDAVSLASENMMLFIREESRKGRREVS